MGTDLWQCFPTENKDLISYSVTLSWHWSNQALPCPRLGGETYQVLSHCFDSARVRTRGLEFNDLPNHSILSSGMRNIVFISSLNILITAAESLTPDLCCQILRYCHFHEYYELWEICWIFVYLVHFNHNSALSVDLCKLLWYCHFHEYYDY